MRLLSPALIAAAALFAPAAEAQLLGQCSGDARLTMATCAADGGLGCSCAADCSDAVHCNGGCCVDGYCADPCVCAGLGTVVYDCAVPGGCCSVTAGAGTPLSAGGSVPIALAIVAGGLLMAGRAARRAGLLSPAVVASLAVALLGGAFVAAAAFQRAEPQGVKAAAAAPPTMPGD